MTTTETPTKQTLDLVGLPDSQWYELRLECENLVYTQVRLVNQYPTDLHYVRCPHCDVNKRKDYSNPPTAWQQVLSVEAVTNEFVSDVHQWTAFILYDRVLRLQSVPPNRRDPYHYRERAG